MCDQCTKRRALVKMYLPPLPFLNSLHPTPPPERNFLVVARSSSRCSSLPTFPARSIIPGCGSRWSCLLFEDHHTRPRAGATSHDDALRAAASGLVVVANLHLVHLVEAIRISTAGRVSLHFAVESPNLPDDIIEGPVDIYA